LRETSDKDESLSLMNSSFHIHAHSASFVIVSKNLSLAQSTSQLQSYLIPVIQFFFESSEQIPVVLHVSPQDFFFKWSILKFFISDLISPFIMASCKHSGLGRN